MTTLSAPEMTAIGAVAGVSEVLIMQVNTAECYRPLKVPKNAI